MMLCHIALRCYNRGVKDLIIIGGASPASFHFDGSIYSRVIAADSGYDTARRLSIVPDAVVGDFDSTRLGSELEAAGYAPCPRDKDESDAELAIRQSSGYDLIGGGEGRIDHSVSLFTVFRNLIPPFIWYMASDILVSMKGALSFTAPPGTALSIIPLLPSAVESRGLRWEIGGRELSGRFMSLSNRTASELVSISASDTVFLRFEPSEYGSVSFLRH